MQKTESVFHTELRAGQIITNRELMRIFRCACEGGIRPSNKTNTIVLVLNHTKVAHDDDWHGNILWFQGAGSKGDQQLGKGRNRTLLDAFETGRPVYLFEVYKGGEYTLKGPVKLSGEPFQRDCPGIDGHMRKVWVFPLEIEDPAGV